MPAAVSATWPAVEKWMKPSARSSGEPANDARRFRLPPERRRADLVDRRHARFAFRREPYRRRFRASKRRAGQICAKGAEAALSGERRAMRPHCAPLGGPRACPAPAAADDRARAGRYAVQPSADGFIRLDTETGAVSHCGRREGVWFCEKLVEDQTALKSGIDALSAAARRTREAAARCARPPAPARAPPADQSGREELRLHDEADAPVLSLAG